MRSQFSLEVAERSGLSECFDRLAADKDRTRPLSTYRLQFNSSFRFVDGRELVPYLQSLGVSTCYASPLLQARTGSIHGYDITDHNQINPEIGTEAELRDMSRELRERGMTLLLDVVPNHMGVGRGSNP